MSALTDRELQSLRNTGSEGEAAAEEIATLRAQLSASEASRKELRGLLQRVHQADALSHNCPLWKDIDAARANDAEQKGGA